MARILIIIVALITLVPVHAYAACSSPAGSAGETMFNSDNHIMQFCDGTNWLGMSEPVSFSANTGCSAPTGTAGEMFYDQTRQVVRYCNGEQWIAVGDSSGYSCTDTGSCISPVGTEGEILYNADYGEMQYCNGHAWIRMRGQSGSCKAGYWVLTGSGFTSTLGGLTGANSLCLTDLTNNNFLGKSDATLDSSHVFAFLCDNTTCNNLQASTRYVFATTGNAAYGGDYFTTDASGLGPNDNANWNVDTKFGSTGTNGAWMNRGDTSSTTTWKSTPYAANSCTNWSQSTTNFARDSEFATSSPTNFKRWNDSNVTCSGSTRRLVCFVNP